MSGVCLPLAEKSIF